jgi:hypothetical protein
MHALQATMTTTTTSRSSSSRQAEAPTLLVLSAQ